MYKRLKNNFVIVDVREKEEHDSSNECIKQHTINIPYYEILSKIKKLKLKKDTPIFVFCSTGKRSKIAAISLIEQGYTNIFDLGGVEGLKYIIDSL